MSETSALATITVGFRTRRRPIGLTVVASAISELHQLYGSLDEVAQRAGVSVDMLRKFLSVARLSPKVTELVQNREIDRVMDVFWLSKVREDSDQLWLARATIQNKLKTAELRDVVTILRRNPREGAERALKRVTGGRKRIERAFAVAMPLRSGTPAPVSKSEAVGVLKHVLPNSGVAIKNRLLVVFFTPHQLTSARKVARQRRVDLTDLANAIILEARA